MILYPAIDIQGGCCVRLRRGDFADSTVFSDDPVAMAGMWEEQGAQALHVVDLDGARLGRPVNLDLIEKIAAAISIPVQYGGGIRMAADLKRMGDTAINRIVIGTAAVTDQVFLMDAVKVMGERLVISIDAEEGMVATHGWQERSMVSAVRFAGYLQSEGVAHILYTDIDRDGMMAGMNLGAVRDLAEQVNIDIIASGGISSLDDLRRLKALALANISGVIVGRALYEASFTVAQAREILD